MALITFDEVDKYARSYALQLRTKTAEKILYEETSKYPLSHQFDIFLSHSYADTQISQKRLLGLKKLLQNMGYEVYVDWIIDRNLDHTKVTAKTARLLRTRMSFSKSLFFATSSNSQNSRWMPWELGYKDGQSSIAGELGTVAILPLVEETTSRSYKGQEYLGIYPYVDKTRSTQDEMKLWIHEDKDTYVDFDRWLAGNKPKKRK